MNKQTTLFISTLLSSTLVSAMQFQTIGYKSISMGGAGVANSSSSIATYNNPALLAKSQYDVEISLGGGASTYDHGAGASVASLDDSGFMDVIDQADEDVSSLTQNDIATLLDGKDVVLGMNGNAVQVSPQAYLSAQVSGFGLGVFGTSDAVAIAKVSQDHDQLIFDNNGLYLDIDGNLKTQEQYENTSMEYALNNGDTYLLTNVIAVAEVPLGYGHKMELSSGNLYLGGSLKYMQAVTYQEDIQIDGDDDSSENKTEEEKSTSFGIDLGIAYEPNDIKDLTLALVAKNINAPKFDLFNGGEVKVDPMVRAGISYNIYDSLEIAMDVDLTSNETFIPEVDSQMIGGGINYQPTSWFSIRAGLMENMDSSNKADMIYTAGLGFGLKWFQIDVSGQMSSQSNTVNDASYPQYAKLNVAILSRW